MKRADAGPTRPSISQFWSLKIRWLTFLNYVKFANLPISRLKNCEMFGQEDGVCQSISASLEQVLQVSKYLSGEFLTGNLSSIFGHDTKCSELFCPARNNVRKQMETLELWAKIAK